MEFHKRKGGVQEKKGIKKARRLVPWACFLNNCLQYTAETMPRPNLICIV